MGKSRRQSMPEITDKMLRLMVASPRVYDRALRIEASKRGFRATGQPIENVAAFLSGFLDG